MLKNKEEDIRRLAGEFLNGDKSAFSRLTELIYSDILNISYRYLANMEDAKDALQASLLKIHDGLKYFKSASKFSTWIYRISINTSLDHLRKRRSIFDLSTRFKSEAKEKTASLKEELDLKEKKELVKKEISKLPLRQKNAFILKHYEELTIEEISTTLGCSESAVKTHLKRAVERLRKKMEVIS
ncbi:MAG: RNA polymerase sigma factor [Candidatus Omnitrophica bacterium]|nr:RNA polymerase sigma factor [Candidatus Omnitrophota bacterium]